MSTTPTLIETDVERHTWMREVNAPSFFVFADGLPWIAYSAEDGDWYATRPAYEDDQAEDGTYPAGVTWNFDGLPLPILVAQSAEMPALDAVRKETDPDA